MDLQRTIDSKPATTEQDSPSAALSAQRDYALEVINELGNDFQLFNTEIAKNILSVHAALQSNSFDSLSNLTTKLRESILRAVPQDPDPSLNASVDSQHILSCVSRLNQVPWAAEIADRATTLISELSASKTLSEYGDSVNNLIGMLCSQVDINVEHNNALANDAETMGVELSRLDTHLKLTSSDLNIGSAQTNRFVEQMSDHLEDLALLPIQDLSEREMVEQACGSIRGAVDRFEVDQNRLNNELVQRSKLITDRMVVAALNSTIMQKHIESYQKNSTADPLTGAENRVSFQNRLSQSCKKTPGSCGLAIIDIDDFKTINDSLGHKIGDKILILICQLIRKFVSAEDHISRLGSDEFSLIIEATDPIKLGVLLNAICQAVGSFKLHHNNTPISIMVSIGYTVNHNKDSESTLYNRADRALYRAKEFGKNRVIAEQVKLAS